MSGNGFGFDKGLLGPTSWAPSTNTPGQPARGTVVKEFETASKEGQTPQQQSPVWPALGLTSRANPVGGDTPVSPGDLGRYNTADVIKDGAFADAKSYITGTR